MKYALFADIHANLEALEAMLDDMQKQGCTHAACLGDIVTDAANPKECLDLIRGMNIPCVQGNRDAYCATNMPLDAFGAQMAKSVAWTREQLTAEDREWLRCLPLTLVVDGFSIVHAGMDAPLRWGYVFDKLAAAASFISHSTPVVFNAHTHVPMAFVKDTTVRGGSYSKFEIELSAVTQTDPPAVEMKGFKLTHPECGARGLPAERTTVRLGGQYGQPTHGANARRNPNADEARVENPPNCQGIGH